ncbi:hypothetical protein J1N35_001521 [Gossypium stocksii]|uniref:DUF4283 domain-containing protein n=1 Tax=Gossypium stocksii TaxID=47602 RepID=A0A9D4AM80_9ROSI|nr:hypothetical protein J1N35_001521 [Gossypium stocksii]
MERTLLELWRPLKGATIKPMGESGLYLIQFYHIIYLKKMILGGPNHLIIVHQLQKGEDPEEINFAFADFWVQVHDLPPRLPFNGLAKSIGNTMEIFLDYNASGRQII